MENLSGEFLIALLVGVGCFAWSFGVLLFLGIKRIIAWWKHEKKKRYSPLRERARTPGGAIVSFLVRHR